MDRGGTKAAEKQETPLRSVQDIVSELRSPIKAGLEAARMSSMALQFDGTAHQISTLQSKCRELEGVLHAKDAELMTLKHQTDQLTNDFLYNLKLLEQRDQEIETLDSADEELKMTLAAKEVLLTKSQTRVNELELEAAQLHEQKARAEDHFRKELQEAHLEFQQEQHKLGEDVNRMQVAIQEAQSKYANDIQQERQFASSDREALLRNYEAQIKESKNTEALAAELRQKLSMAETQVESGNAELQVALDKLQGAILEIGELEKKHKKTCHDSQSLLRAKEEEIQDLKHALEAEKNQLEVEGKELLEKAGKANEKNKKLQKLCEQQNQQLSKNTIEQKQQMEEKKKLSQKLKETQDELEKLEEEKLSLQETLHHQLSRQEGSEKSIDTLKKKQEEMEKKNEAMQIEVIDLRSKLVEKSKELDIKREKVRSTEEDYRRERKQRHALQRQLASCLEEKENHHKQKMDQILLALKKEKSTSWSLLDAAELRGRNAEKELEIVKKRIEQSWEKRCKSPQPVSPRRPLITPTPPTEPAQASPSPIRPSHEYLLNRNPSTPISEPWITTPKREPADNLLQNTFELLQSLVEKIDGGDGNPTKTSYLASERKPPPQQAAAMGGVSGASPRSCRSRLSNVHVERESDHVAERLNRVIGMGSTEDMEMQKAIKKLHKERKKLVEKQKDIEAMSCRGGATSSTENEHQTQIDFLKLRSEQLSEENGRLRYQLAATSNGSPTDNLANTALPTFQPLSDQMPASAPSFQRSSEPSIIHPMESLTRFSTPPQPVSTLIPEKRFGEGDERSFKRESGLERAKSKILRAKEQLRKAGK
ncbi:hypothetical protein BSKO_06438 [Bryopsis sp. KO-2023]|nr:hypothetical protein BSKO_06438 [Bryopsis sp. KO-2023]